MYRRIAAAAVTTAVLATVAPMAFGTSHAQATKQTTATAPSTMLIVSHAAGFLTADEATPAGVRAAAKAGVTMVEIDVQLSKGGAKVVSHDLTLNRVTDCTGPIANHTWTQLKRCGVYSLNEMLDVIRDNGMSVYLHLKSNSSVGRAKDILDEVTRNKMTGRATYFSSNYKFLDNMEKAGAKRENMAFLVKKLGHWSYDYPEYVYFEGPVDADLVAKAKARGIKVGTVGGQGLTEQQAADLGMTMFMSNDLPTSVSWKRGV